MTAMSPTAETGTGITKIVPSARPAGAGATAIAVTRRTVAHHGRRDPGQTRRPRRSPALTRWTAAAMAAPQTVERSGRADWTLMTAIHDALHCDLDQLLHTTAGPAAARARWIVFRDQLHRHLAAEHAAMWRPARAKLTGDPRGQALLEAMDEEQLGVIPGRANLTGPAQEDRQGEEGR